MTIKKIISTICASVFAFSCIGFNADAKVIEPEIVKTETWTTSYFIDDDMDTLYPYIQCEADIYNDGTLKLYMWNTHEWGGFTTVSHRIKVVQRFNPVKEDSLAYALKYSGKYINDSSNEVLPISKETYYNNTFGAFVSYDSQTPFPVDNSILNSIDLNYYSKKYSCKRSGSFLFFMSSYSSSESMNFYYQEFNGSWHPGREDLHEYYGDVALSEVDFSDSRPKNSCVFEMIPIEDPTGTYNFRLFGHDITITPELLSGNIVAEPELTEQEKYIKQLEEENSKLKTEIESYKKLDFDGDGLLTNADAQMILVYYTNSLVGKTTGKIEDYSEYVKQISG